MRGQYRDDQLIILRNYNGSKIDKIWKKIIKTFKQIEFDRYKNKLKQNRLFWRNISPKKMKYTHLKEKNDTYTHPPTHTPTKINNSHNPSLIDYLTTQYNTF